MWPLEDVLFIWLVWACSDLEGGETYGNEQIGHLALVFQPGFAVLGATTLDVTQGAVGDHAGEEERVEPGEGARETGDQAPV